jgi:hypothetical protein
MDLTDPKLLKLKGVLFLLLGMLSAGILLAMVPDLRVLMLLAICVWAFSRFYYFAFYVLHHYADPNFRYSGLWDLIRYLVTGKPR